MNDRERRVRLRVAAAVSAAVFQCIRQNLRHPRDIAEAAAQIVAEKYEDDAQLMVNATNRAVRAAGRR